MKVLVVSTRGGQLHVPGTPPGLYGGVDKEPQNKGTLHGAGQQAVRGAGLSFSDAGIEIDQIAVGIAKPD